MFNSLKKAHLRANALVRIGNSLGGIFEELKKLCQHKNDMNDYNIEDKSTLLYLTYKKTLIIDEMDEFGLDFGIKLSVIEIAGLSRITLLYAIDQIMSKVYLLSEEMDLQSETQNILERGILYDKIREKVNK